MFVLGAAYSYAQSTVSVRGGKHDGYSRLVFDWPEKTSYKIAKSGGSLSISFDTSSNIDLQGINQETLANIGQILETSSNSGGLNIAVQIKPESNFRHFKIGNRIVVDVYDAEGEVAKVEPSSKPVESVPVPEVSEEKPVSVDLKSTAESVIVEESGVEPHVITLTATQSVGLAAFEREGFLWMVFDDPSLTVPPVLAGPDKKNLPKLEKIELANATAYRMQKPMGVKFYAEGGGLLWRIVLTPNPRRTKVTKPKVKHDGIDAIAGGSLVWPFDGARKIVTFTDPLIGDDITVVTVDSSTDLTGDKRQYVELEILPSIAGLALVPKIDDTDISVTPNGVVVTRPRGLALSSQRDIAPVVLKDDIQKEEEFFEAQENPSRLTRLFNFTRWEMGGLNALEENRRVIMVSMAAKKGAAKVEDLITLAKLNIANDRGQEALGLLRVASNELPGISENAEFIGLRGVAATLAGKYDEAIADLAERSLAPYGEANYWKAYALAGLEDWRQANQVMPRDLNVLKKYPVHIRQPISLALTEVSLRAGNKNVARDLLELLEPEFVDMSLSRQSAWKYLNGELERQMDQPKLALENWETLISGRDDYYRAKAGLSLTKLQLERKKITPAKAIDRLEGLRYAWRGDELETLINFRLGEVYIDNEEYLKGLSVLRNAVSLSPDLPIAEEVTSYMTQTFRTLFTDGKLKEVSPLDAVSIYDEFKELTPIGEEGDLFVQELAERLVDVDLLGRASNLLNHQLTHRLKGKNAVKVAIRLAAIRLLDNKAEGALRALEVAENSMKEVSLPDAQSMEFEKREIKLLKARALSKAGQVDEALAILKNMPEDNNLIRLKADIAWNSGRWKDAAEAFKDLIVAEGVSKTRPMDEYQTNLVLNRSIALNLAGDRTGLDNLRAEYGDLMMQTDKARIFELVSRPRQLGMLNSKESVASLISEVDLFGAFLDNYRQIESAP